MISSRASRPKATRSAPAVALAVTFAVTLAAALAFGCGGDRAAPPPATPGPTSPVRAERIPESYRPPSDGLLTTKQIETYLSVADKAAAETSAARPTPPAVTAGGLPAPGEIPDDAPLDVKTARDLGLNVEEYLWIKERILEAEAAFSTAKLNAETIALVEKTLADLRERHASAADEASRTLVNEQISTFDAELVRLQREAGEREPESVRGNMKRIEPYRARLAAVQREIGRLLPGLESAVRPKAPVAAAGPTQTPAPPPSPAPTLPKR